MINTGSGATGRSSGQTGSYEQGYDNASPERPIQESKGDDVNQPGQQGQQGQQGSGQQGQQGQQGGPGQPPTPGPGGMPARFADQAAQMGNEPPPKSPQDLMSSIWPILTSHQRELVLYKLMPQDQFAAQQPHLGAAAPGAQPDMGAGAGAGAPPSAGPMDQTPTGLGPGAPPPGGLDPNATPPGGGSPFSGGLGTGGGAPTTPGGLEGAGGAPPLPTSIPGTSAPGLPMPKRPGQR